MSISPVTASLARRARLDIPCPAIDKPQPSKPEPPCPPTSSPRPSTRPSRGRDEIGPEDQGRGARGGRTALDLLDARRRRASPNARRTAMARQSMAEEGRAAVVPPQRHERHPGRPRQGGVVGQGAIPNSRAGAPTRFRNAGFRAVPGCVVRRSAYHRARRRADAVLRQSRRLCRFRHHGRHLGHGRLLRADRQELPHFRRRRHRRRARAVAGRARSSSRTIASSARARKSPKA